MNRQVISTKVSSHVGQGVTCDFSRGWLFLFHFFSLFRVAPRPESQRAPVHSEKPEPWPPFHLQERSLPLTCPSEGRGAFMISKSSPCSSKEVLLCHSDSQFLLWGVISGGTPPWWGGHYWTKCQVENRSKVSEAIIIRLTLINEVSSCAYWKLRVAWGRFLERWWSWTFSQRDWWRRKR